MRRALVTGATGQDAAFLIPLLLDKGYEVHALCRRSSRGYDNFVNIKKLVNDPEVYRKKLFIHAGDLCDGASLLRIINDVMPDEVYNLAAQADVQESFFMPEYSVEVNGNGVLRILEILRRVKPDARFYQASTSELYGAVAETPQNEETLFNPQSPYAFGKWVGYKSVKLYREAYGMFACNGILFNHASEYRTDDYVDRKVTKAVARIKMGLQKELRMGNLESYRDWGYSKEYVWAMWKMLQMDEPDDYVIGTGDLCQVKEWVEEAFKYVGLNWEDYVVQDPKFFRPAEVDILQADTAKAKKVLGFEAKTKWKELCHLMIDHDLYEISNSKA